MRIHETLLGALAMGLAVPVVLAAGCASHKKVYTTPTVKAAIDKSVARAMKWRRKGRLDKASDIILAEVKRVVKEYPTAVLNRKMVKKLLRASTKIGNLCLDYGQELTQEAVSDKMWRLADVYKKRYAKHMKWNKKLRELYDRLPKTAVVAKPATAESLASSAAGTTDATPTSDATATKPARPATQPRPGTGAGAGSDEAPVTP